MYGLWHCLVDFSIKLQPFWTSKALANVVIVILIFKSKVIPGNEEFFSNWKNDRIFPCLKYKYNWYTRQWYTRHGTDNTLDNGTVGYIAKKSKYQIAELQ